MKNPNCVYIARSQAQAAIIAHYLETFEIETKVVDTTALGYPVGLSFFSADPKNDGWQVWVVNDDDRDAAIEHLRDQQNRLEQKRIELESLGPVTVACDSCNQLSEFPGRARGTVQTCPNCKSFIDVEGAPDEFEWPEFREEDRSE